MPSLKSRAEEAHISIEECKVPGQLNEGRRLLLVVCLDDESRLARRLAVLLRLALNEAAHVRDVVVRGVPFPVDLVARPRKRMVRVYQRNLALVWARADLERLAPDGPVGVGVFVAVGGLEQVVDARVEVPVACNVVKGMVLQHQIYDMFNLNGSSLSSAGPPSKRSMQELLRFL